MMKVKPVKLGKTERMSFSHGAFCYIKITRSE